MLVEMLYILVEVAMVEAEAVELLQQVQLLQELIQVVQEM
jgi:hypothetical protein